MTQGIHTVFHFDENDKIDVVNQYLDRATIMEAMKNKKWFLKNRVTFFGQFYSFYLMILRQNGPSD
jgi:hypothetical protein